MAGHALPYKPGTHQKAAYTGTAGVISNATNAQTQVIRVVVTSAAYIAIGASPTATTSDIYMPAGVPEYFVVPPSMKVSAVQVAAGGDVHVTEMSR